MKNASYEIRPSGAALVTIDMEGGAVNVMNDAFLAMFDEVLDRLEAERDTLSGVIVTSGKSTFVAGGDIAKILQLREQGPMQDSHLSKASRLNCVDLRHSVCLL